MQPTPITGIDHIDGPADAPLTLIEYGDFECPFCVRAYPVLEQVREAYRGRLRFVYRHVPKSHEDGFSKQAAEASEFAAAAGSFWPMHAELFSHPNQHEPDQLAEYAAEIGLDREECRKALTEHRFAGRVKEIAIAAIRSGIIGTPVLFINGERYEDRIELALLRRSLDAALA